MRIVRINKNKIKKVTQISMESSQIWIPILSTATYLKKLKFKKEHPLIAKKEKLAFLMLSHNIATRETG
jgi:hypothetical protein